MLTHNLVDKAGEINYCSPSVEKVILKTVKAIFSM